MTTRFRDAIHRVCKKKEGKKVRGLKASIPGAQTTSFESHNIRHFDAFSDDSIQSKKPSGGPKGLIGPPCHGAPGRRRH
jgi:hypothetical protein